MQNPLIDTHAHIYLPEFDKDRDAIIKKAAVEGVAAIYLPAIDSSTHDAMLRTEQEYATCQSMMGLHPCSVNKGYKQELETVEQHLRQRRFAAVGEIGLDFYWDKTFTAEQYTAFHEQIVMAQQYNLPVVIHSRNATDECIAVVSQYTNLKGVFHCFSGTEVQARTLIALGFYLGIGGVVTFKNSGLDKVVQAIGLPNIVLETDAPYLAPVPYRGKRNEPAHTRLVASKIAGLLNVELAEVAEMTTDNAKKLFQFTGKP